MELDDIYKRLPRILVDYLYGSDQIHDLTPEILLREAEWCDYNATENEAGGAYEYPTASKKALRRYIERMWENGVVAAR